MKNSRTKLIIMMFFMFLLVSCAEMGGILDTTPDSSELTSDQVSSGLKEALKVGTKLAVSNLSSKNGFFLDKAVKILLPENAKKALDLITKVPMGKKMVNDLVLRLNRSAECAVKGATPIFINAITSLTINDAFNILKGDKDAATQYLYNKTNRSLVKLFKPEIEKSLSKKLVGNISALDSWDFFSNNYNQVSNSVAGKVTGLTPLEVDLSSYVTKKATSALFSKIALEEAKIRKNPIARTTSLLKKVFGYLDKEE